MDILSRGELKTLIDHRSKPAVSFYLPTHRAGAEMQQDPIRLKNLLRHADESPTARSMRHAEFQALLKPVQDLAQDDVFWRGQGDGLAIFLAPEFLRAYRLPMPFPELSVVSDRFHLKPLLPLLTGEGRFCILALSQHSVRLLHATRGRAVEIPLRGAPSNVAEALKFDEPGGDARGRQRSHRPSGGGERAYHGRGHVEPDEKEHITRFFHQIDQAVHAQLKNEHLPLVLAGVDFEVAIYRGLNTYGHVLPESVNGNPDQLPAHELLAKAWALVAPHFQAQRHAAEARFRELEGTGAATHDLGAVLPAAHEGRVESLFVALGVQRWGRFNALTYITDAHPSQQDGDEDLLDLAAIQTLLHHGRVFAVAPNEIPGVGAAQPLAAVFRY
jgi:hypothetical protein